NKNKALTLRTLRELQPGDYVTHIDHGVGVYSGLQKIETNGKLQEAVRIIYKDNDILYVNINSLHKISKYTGKEGTVPKINKLGSDAWQKLKEKTTTRVKAIAFDLIKLYAQRKAQPGFAHSPDNYMQHELEASFMYEDTPDQSKAIADVKKDMESPSPMDRLVCGDVGFGKTEVAIRAAFKTCLDGKQAAVLVPTTILAFQHYRSFSDRLKDFPVTIEYVNRFRSAKEKKEIYKRMEESKTDNIHTSQTHVHTRTYAPTPIPRTPQYSIMTARNLIIIYTPPPNRQPIESQVLVFNQYAIRVAIYFGTYRVGHVFFIHNSVLS